MTHTQISKSLASQRGAALIVALVMLLVMTVLGVTAARNTNLQERMAGNLRDSNLAFQAAEHALRDGERFLRGATLPPFAGADGLLAMQDGAGFASFWYGYDWAGSSRTAASVPDVASDPLYVIEELPAVPVEGGSERFGALPDVGMYRLTARAVGGSADAVSILQTTYRR
jgi:type IV pilus assembly protein PilX